MAETEGDALIPRPSGDFRHFARNPRGVAILTPYPADPFRYDPVSQWWVGWRVARQINRLTARQVVTLAEPGYHPDGSGLYLQVTPTGTKSWILRYQRLGKRREMGLGSVAVVSLQEARQSAAQARKVVAAGKDPITERKVAQAAGLVLWGYCVDSFIEANRAAWKTDAQAEQWEQSLRDHGPDRDLPVSAVDTGVVLKRLQAIWTKHTETATRVRGRTERVWDWAKVSGFVSGENPARWRGHLDKLLPRPVKVAKPKHHRAMPYAAAPAFMVQLAGRDGRARRALRFTILTACRTSETTGAEWPEFDLDAKLWTIPASRMKGGQAHAVPLPDEAVAILESLPRSKPPFRLTENAMLYLLQKDMKQPFTVHGFRSSFSDWAHETTDFPNHVIEMALAHTIQNKAEAAYRRGALLDKRRELMEAWAAYLSGESL